MPVDEKYIFRIAIMLIAMIASIGDIRKKEISGGLLVLSGICSAGYVLLELILSKFSITGALLSLVPGIFFLFLSFISKESIGYGDGLLITLISMPFGFNALCVGIVSGLFFSTLISIFILITSLGNKKTRIPFVPFLTAGLGVSLYAGF